MIDVAFTPAEAKAADVAVVIDVLRATTTATQALASGYRRVLCVDSLERALRMRAKGRLLAGEQHGRMPPGFDLGNSPGDVAKDSAEELVLATTNGAPTIVEASRRSSLVLLACLMNLEAVRAELAGAADVQIVCSGTYGAIALEDVYVAGRLSAALAGERTDAALAAEAVARAHPSAYEVLAVSSNAQALVEAGLGDDIEFCARESVLDVVPRVERTRPGLAIVVAGVPSAAVDGAGNVRSVVEPTNRRSGRATEPQPAS
jgi:2-phosphosulfolactate phosphatase